MKHKNKVFVLCLKCGLLWRGLVHDLSKFSPIEFFEGVKYYAGKHSPIVNCRKDKGYSLAWLHHKGRNKHHIEYWYDKENGEQMNIPYKYAVECICDKVAAAKCYKGKEYNSSMALEHWMKFGIQTPLNENMKNFFTQVFTDLISMEEKEVINKKYMKKMYSNLVLNKQEKEK